jgi:ABC-type transport system involved in cytochrome bd biosynthesis fused ATPase/permease subunit
VLATIAVRIREVENAVAGFLSFVRSTAQLVPLGLALIVLSPVLAGGAAIILVPFSITLAVMRRRVQHAFEESHVLVEQLHAGTDELVKNLDVWRSYGKSARISQLIASVSENAGRASARVHAGRAALSSGNEVLGALGLVGAIALSKRLGVSLGDGRLLTFATVFFMAYRPLRDLGDARALCLSGCTAARALQALDGGVPSYAALTSALSSPESAKVRESAEIRASDGLRAEGFGGARHGTRTSFSVSLGEIVCIVGPTGSGKTTLLRCLLGLERASGRLSYRGRDLTLAGVGPDERPFAWVPQDAPLVTGSLLENVSLFGADRDSALVALDGIGAGSLLERVGSDRIGPGGRALSGGESRQVALARAMYTGQPVLLLDEPTEGLDEIATARALSAFQRIRSERALVIVTHRPEVCRIADRIVRIGEREREREPDARARALSQN